MGSILVLSLAFGIGQVFSQGTASAVALVVSSCGTATFVVGRPAPLTVDLTGVTC